MMISLPAWWCLESTWHRLLRRQAAEPEPDRAPDSLRLSAVVADGDGTDAVAPAAVFAAPSPPPERAEERSGPLTAAERRARAAALRALAFGRGRRFDAARAAFTDAAMLDPTLDLTRTPAFWKLERAAHEAAIDAYVAAGRDRDAAVLRARVRSTFRPRALRTRQEPVLSP